MSKKSVHYTSSPLLASKVPLWRSRLVMAFITLGFLGLVARAAYIQVINQDFFTKKGDLRYARTPEMPATRGRILDRNGLLLASSVPAKSLWLDPEDFKPSAKQYQQLADLLQTTEAELKKKARGKNFVWLKRQVDEALASKVLALKIRGVHARQEYRREYPEGETIAQVVGTTNVDDNGRDGIERLYNEVLSGKAGSRRVLKDRLGNVVEDDNIVPPADGQDVILSIDSRLQFFAYQKLKEAVTQNKASSGSMVMLDAQTGEVLVMANYPSFNPNLRQKQSSSEVRNRAVVDVYEPGSSIKPFTVALALSEGKIQPSTVFETAPGYINITGSIIKDTHPAGALTVNKIIQHSSNVGTVKIASLVSAKSMWEFFTQVGFGQRPEVKFPGAASGRLRPYKTWRPVEKATISYGYGISASLLQMAQAYTIFSTDGIFIPATLQKQTQAVLGERIITAQQAQQMRHMLHMVTQAGGTGTLAAIDGYSVGGKTGTVHKLVNGGYAESQYSGFFVGLAPISQPRIVAAIMIDNPSNGVYYGGAVAGPVFASVVEQALRILQVQPDQPLAQQERSSLPREAAT